jgi:hypothetical protein
MASEARNGYGKGDITTPFGGYRQSGFGGRDNELEAMDQSIPAGQPAHAAGGIHLRAAATAGVPAAAGVAIELSCDLAGWIRAAVRLSCH